VAQLCVAALDKGWAIAGEPRLDLSHACSPECINIYGLVSKTHCGLQHHVEPDHGVAVIILLLQDRHHGEIERRSSVWYYFSAAMMALTKITDTHAIKNETAKSLPLQMRARSGTPTINAITAQITITKVRGLLNNKYFFLILDFRLLPSFQLEKRYTFHMIGIRNIAVFI
jgi:hypothetical protein